MSESLLLLWRSNSTEKEPLNLYNPQQLLIQQNQILQQIILSSLRRHHALELQLLLFYTHFC